MSLSFDPLIDADKRWKAVFNQGPYTGITMLDYLRSKAGKAGISWNDMLKGGPEKSLSSVTQAVLESDRSAAFQDTWKKPGRCTSFAIKITRDLEHNFPGKYEFQIYDLSRHRIARCAKTGVLIDSSSIKGALLLPEGEWLRIEGSEASWKWKAGKSKFERKEGTKMKSSKTIISAQVAMSTCLLELPQAPNVATLFREIEPQAGADAVWWGMMIWNWSKKRLELTPSLATPNAKLLIKFNGKGTAKDLAECKGAQTAFVQAFGGSNAAVQWASVEDIMGAIWNAAISIWGSPVLEIVGQKTA